MPESPDFDAIARALMTLASKDGTIVSTTAHELIEQLRQVWNARGAADALAVDWEAHRVHEEATRTGRTDLVMNLGTAIRSLDR